MEVMPIYSSMLVHKFRGWVLCRKVTDLGGIVYHSYYKTVEEKQIID